MLAPNTASLLPFNSSLFILQTSIWEPLLFCATSPKPLHRTEPVVLQPSDTEQYLQDIEQQHRRQNIFKRPMIGDENQS